MPFRFTSSILTPLCSPYETTARLGPLEAGVTVTNAPVCTTLPPDRAIRLSNPSNPASSRRSFDLWSRSIPELATQKWQHYRKFPRLLAQRLTCAEDSPVRTIEREFPCAPVNLQAGGWKGVTLNKLIIQISINNLCNGPIVCASLRIDFALPKDAERKLPNVIVFRMRTK